MSAAGATLVGMTIATWILAATVVLALEGGTQVLIFGGNGTQATWAWNGITRTRLFPDMAPPPRSNGSATDDTATSKVVLFGGGSAGHPATYLDGTWLWTAPPGSSLADARTSPAVRAPLPLLTKGN